MPSKTADDTLRAGATGAPRYEDVSPILGVFPRSRFGRVMFAWAALNVVLTLLPVFLIAGNGAEIVFGLLPMTIFYSYAVFTLNCVFGLVFYLFRARVWSQGEAPDA